MSTDSAFYTVGFSIAYILAYEMPMPSFTCVLFVIFAMVALIVILEKRGVL